MSGFLDALAQHLQSALRSLRRAPGYSLVVVASLSLGIGANTAIFSLLNALLLKPLPVTEPERLLLLADREERPTTSWTHPIWEGLRDAPSGPLELFAWSTSRLDLAQGGETRFVRGQLTSGSFFEALRVSPAPGRAYTASEDRRGCAAPPAVISHGFWQSQYAGAEEAIGSTLLLEGQAFSVVGVAPAGFFGPSIGQSFDVAIPLCAERLLRGADSWLDERHAWWVTIMGRLRPGATREQADAALSSLQPALRESTLPARGAEEYLRGALAWSSAASGVSDLRDRYRQALLALMALVGLVLLLACANIANLALARAASREHEIAVRLSLGASRGRVVSQLLAESVLLGSLGAVAALAVAGFVGRALVAGLSTARSTVFLDLRLDPAVLAFTAAGGLLTGLLFGALPAWRAARRTPGEALKQRSRGSSGAGRGSLAARWLVVVQMALSCVIVVGAGLFVRSYAALASLDPGFDSSRVLVVSADLRRADVDAEARLPLFERLLETVRSLPGVERAALSVLTPISGSLWQYRIQADGFQPRSERDSIALYNFVSPGYFETLGTTLVAGRDLSPRDTPGSPRVAVVNEAFARKFLGARSPLGARYRIELSDQPTEVEVVGVVRDARYQSLREDPRPTAYAPLAQAGSLRPSLSVSLRTAAAPAALRKAVVDAIARENPEVALSFRTLESQLSDSLVQERLIARLSGLFGLLGLGVAAVGLAGLVAFSVNSRRGELAVRAALGAAPGHLVSMLLREALLLCGLGLAAGTLASLGAGRLVSALLYGVPAHDPATLAVASATLGLVALVSGYLPARRAARVDPMECLRAE